MTRVLVLFAIVAGIMAAAAEVRAQSFSCECRSVPFEGRYDPGNLTLEYLDGDKHDCPTRILLTAPRQGAPDAVVTLTCDGAGGWFGTEESAMGTFTWDVRPKVPAPPEAAATTPEAIAPEAHLDMRAGVELARTVQVHLGLPARLGGLGKADRTLTATLATPAAAPECVCEIVRLEFAHLLNMRRHYADPDLLEVARRDTLRGGNTEADFWMDDAGQLHRFEAKAPREETYNDLVSNVARGAVSTEQVKAGAYTDQDIETATEEKLKSGSHGGLQARTYAGTNPLTCRVTMPSSADVRDRCDPAIVALAALRHEQQHRKRCRALNRPSTYTLPDGTSLDWQKQAGAFGVIYKGTTYPRSGYMAWSQNPANLSADEVASYSVEIAMLKKYLSTYCM